LRAATNTGGKKMLTNPNPHVQPPNTPRSILTQYLGSEDAAALAREDIRRRQRADTVRNRAIALDLDRDHADAAHFRSKIQRLRDQLTDERHARENLEDKVAEMDDAINYLRHITKEATRGQDRTRGAVA
jgi:hypothetical protein